jgi:hypothetical protein
MFFLYGFLTTLVLAVTGLGAFLLWDKIQETLYVRKRMAEIGLQQEPNLEPTTDRLSRDFSTLLTEEYLAACPKPISKELLATIVDGFQRYNKPKTAQQALDYYSYCLAGLIAFTKKVPKEAFEQRRITSPFWTMVPSTANYRLAYYELMPPFLVKERQLDFMDWRFIHPAAHLRHPGDYPEYESDQKSHDRKLAQYDRDYQAAWEDPENEDELPFAGTPFYGKSFLFMPPSTEAQAFEISEDVRFFGQWIIGEPGAGKTTFISTMIAEDLKKVARNEASLFVMDSQNELIPDLARLEIFAPGRPLHGKLTYLEPNPDFPLALNIFDINKKRASSLSSSEERMMYEAAVEWMVDFFLKSLVKSDETSAQETFLAYVIPAVLAIPNATVLTLLELLDPPPSKNAPPPGYEKYKEYFCSLRPRTQKWLKDDMHGDRLKATRDAIRSRLDGFVARGFFADMFSHPENKLDLFNELQSGKVILINTKGALLKKNLEPFGRYFIARLLQAAEERMFIDRGNRFPVYAYIDEASDYVSNEENIEELKNKARKQKVALIIANQMESQIEMPLVRESLGKMAIQCRGEPPLKKGDAPTWHIQLGKQEPVRVSFPDTQFSKMLGMSERDFQAMLGEMRARYCTTLGKEEPKQESSRQERPKQEPPKSGPKDDEYDDRYDMLDKVTLHPRKAREGTVLTVKLPNGRTHQQHIPPGTKNGYRFCVKGASKIRRPDNRNGNFWVELEIASFGEETDARPW